MELSVDGIDKHNALKRNISRFAGSVDRAKGDNRLRPFVIENGKVLLLQASHRLPGAVGYHDVERNAAIGVGRKGGRAFARRCGLSRRRALLGESRK
jgi:hypothetical protein